MCGFLKPASALVAVIALPAVGAAADLGRTSDEIERAAVVEAYDGGRRFYVRADAGIALNSFGGFSQDEVASNGGSFVSESLGDNPFIGAGFGWQLSNRWRLDVTGEYRSTANVKTLDNLFIADFGGPGEDLQSNTLYQGEYSSVVGLVNIYADLFTWKGITPYIGGGVGFSANRFSDLTTSSEASVGGTPETMSSGIAADKWTTNFAWALSAGASYDLNPNGKLDIGYRYTHLGDRISATTGLIDCICGSIGSPLEANGLESHDLRIGVRWLMDQPNRQIVAETLK